MFSVFLLFFGVPMTPKVEKNTPWGPGAALANPPLGGLTLTGTAKAGPQGPPTRRLAKFR